MSNGTPISPSHSAADRADALAVAWSANSRQSSSDVLHHAGLATELFIGDPVEQVTNGLHGRLGRVAHVAVVRTHLDYVGECHWLITMIVCGDRSSPRQSRKREVLHDIRHRQWVSLAELRPRHVRADLGDSGQASVRRWRRTRCRYSSYDTFSIFRLIVASPAAAPAVVLSLGRPHSGPRRH